MKTQKFYYAESNDAYVEMPCDIYETVIAKVDENSELLDKYPTMSVPELREFSKTFAENEDYIQEQLHMTDDQFNNIILY